MGGERELVFGKKKWVPVSLKEANNGKVMWGIKEKNIFEMAFSFSRCTVY